LRTGPPFDIRTPVTYLNMMGNAGITGAVKSTDPPAPGVLLFGAAVFMVAAVAVQTWLSLAILAVLLAMVGLSLPISIGKLLRTLAGLWPLWLITFLIHWVVTSHFVGTSLWATDPEVGSGGLLPAALFTVRLAMMVTVARGLHMLHEPQRYGRSVGRALSAMPFGRRLFNRLEIAATLALRFVPQVAEYHHRLKIAQAARGEQIPRSVLDRLRRTSKLLYPLMFGTLRQAERVAVALEARGFNPDCVRTALARQRVPARVLFLVAAFAIGCVAAAVVGRA